MNNTSRHIVAAIGWLGGIPLLVLPLFASGAFPLSTLHTTAASIVWGVGLVAIFGSWALRDAPTHGKSRNVALAFTAAWFLVLFLAVFPYLFVTRGAKAGLVAALKFLCLCLGFAILWMTVPALFGRVF